MIAGNETYGAPDLTNQVWARDKHDFNPVRRKKRIQLSCASCNPAFDYKEVGPQLLLQAFLQRIINSGGILEREYGLGTVYMAEFIQSDFVAPTARERDVI